MDPPLPSPPSEATSSWNTVSSLSSPSVSSTNSSSSIASFPSWTKARHAPTPEAQRFGSTPAAPSVSTRLPFLKGNNDASHSSFPVQNSPQFSLHQAGVQQYEGAVAPVPATHAPVHHSSSMPAHPVAEANGSATSLYMRAFRDAAAAHLQFLAPWALSGGAAAAPQRTTMAAAPIIIQNHTHAEAESHVKPSETSSLSVPFQPTEPFLNRLTNLITQIWQSKINRVLLLGIAGASVYFLWEWKQHRRRMELIQRRIDAHPILKFGQFLALAAGDKKRSN